MLEDLFEKPWFRRYFPLAAGLVFIVVFISLGLWQLDRAAEKQALLAQFDNDAPYAKIADHGSLAAFDRIEAFGQYVGGRQVLIDNIVQNGRLGYFVIAPFRSTTDDALLLINRGWVEKPATSADTPDVAVDDDFRTVRGFVGHLPRVGIRPGEAFEGSPAWPRVAVYPSIDEVARELGAELLPIAMLLHPDADDGFVRRWEPDTQGPATHYSYAFQWFAMAAAVAGLVIWHGRKRFRSGQNSD